MSTLGCVAGMRPRVLVVVGILLPSAGVLLGVAPTSNSSDPEVPLRLI